MNQAKTSTVLLLGVQGIALCALEVDVGTTWKRRESKLKRYELTVKDGDIGKIHLRASTSLNCPWLFNCVPVLHSIVLGYSSACQHFTSQSLAVSLH